MIPVQQVMPSAVEAMLRRAPLTREKVAFAWRLTVGPAIDRATTVELRDGFVLVRAKDRSWQREVERSITLIRARLAALLGDRAVRRIEVSCGGHRTSS